MSMRLRSFRLPKLSRSYASLPRNERPRSNHSFLIGASVGVSVGLASALYISNYILPKDPSAPPKFGGPKEVQKAIVALQSAFPGRTSIDEQDCIVHGSSSWFPVHNEGVPNIVVYPESTADVQEIAKIASKFRIPLISYGAGTSIEGQFSPPYGGICIDFSTMDAILELSEDDMTVTLQPGMSWQTLNSELDDRKTGLFFPVDPGPGASIGGCIGTSCSGPNAARYGTMKEGWVVNMTVVTIDGRVFQTRSRAKKSSTGYDLTRLMIGAEGTLGIVTEVTLKLTNKPEHEVVGTCAFADVSQVTKLVIEAKKRGVNAQCLELLDAGNMPAINAYSDRRLNFPTRPHLFFKLSGASERVLAEETKVMRALCRQFGDDDFRVAKDRAERELIWGARKNLLLASLAYNTELGGASCAALSTDVCVPISKLPELVTSYRALSQERGITSSILGHVADGNFHSLILYDDTREETYRAAKQLSEDLLRLSLDLGGTVSGEHGVGSTKRDWLVHEYGTVGIELMRAIKDAWDPHGLLNPGKLLPDRNRS